MQSNKLILIFTLFICNFSALALNANITKFDSYGSDDVQVEVFTASLASGDENSPKNKKIIESFKKDVGLDADTPIIAETISPDQASRMDVNQFTIDDVEDFAKEYQLANTIVSEQITEEAVKYVESGDLPKQFKNDLTKSLLDKNWTESKQVEVFKNRTTKASGIAGKFGLSKSNKRLTVIRMVYNGAANVLAAFVSQRHLVKTSLFPVLLKSGLFGLISSTMTGAVQVNDKWFEKLMASNYAKLKFFGIEAGFITVSILASAALGIKDYTWMEYAIDVLGYGLATTVTQGRAEELAAKQIDKLREVIDLELVKIQNSTTLSEQAKSIMIARLMANRANLAETFSRVMLGGSMIWSTAIALAATLPGTAGLIASYSVFGALHVYANTIKYVGSDKMMNPSLKNYLRGAANFWKAQPGNIKSGFKTMAKELKIAFGGPTHCDSNYK